MRREVPHQRARESGFTLLEAVVTLVIVSLLIAVLSQALTQALSLRERLSRLQEDARTDALQEAWFRESVSGAQADLPDALGVMEGSAERMTYVTSTPLVARGLVRASWRIEREAEGMSLRYSDPDADLLVVAGPLTEAAFSYLGADGSWSSEWIPPPADARQLPRLVRFEARTPRGRLHWLVPLLSESLPAGDLRLEMVRDGL